MIIANQDEQDLDTSTLSQQKETNILSPIEICKRTIKKEVSKRVEKAFEKVSHDDINLENLDTTIQ